MSASYVSSQVRKFRRDEEGVALVEFAIFLPVFVLSFFVVVEFSRIFFSYQGAVVGVRDATRYLARVAPAGICDGAIADPNSGTNPGKELVISDTNGNPVAVARQIIERNMDNESRIDLPANVFLTTVSTTYECVITVPGEYRQDNVPLVRVAATFRIVLPLGGILELNGLPLIPEVSHEVVDIARIFGA
jgi:Flp pilus assembly protein TadG